LRRECPVHLGDKAELSADGAGLRVTILLDREAVAYFKKLAAETGVAYQVLINLYLKECARLAPSRPPERACKTLLATGTAWMNPTPVACGPSLTACLTFAATPRVRAVP